MASIEERKNKDGRVTSWRVVWRDNGQKHAQTVDSEAAALQWKAVLEAAKHNTAKAERALLAQLSDGPTFATVADEHMKRLVDITPGTLNTYHRMLDNHLLPAFGEMPIDQITEDDVAGWVAHMRDLGRSPKTIRNVHGLLFSVMRTAVKRKHRPDNPCMETRLPKSTRTEDHMAFLTHDEFALLLSCVDRHFHPLVLFLVGTGARFSEASAITKADFTDNRGEYSVRIDKAWKRGAHGRGRYLGTPKSSNSVRTIGLDPDLAVEVAPLVAASKDGEPVFKMKRGGVLDTQAFYNKVWRHAVEDAHRLGLRKSPRVHDLRHTFASWMLAGGISMQELSWIMGHESEAITRKVYAHVTPQTIQAGALAATKALGPIMVARRQAAIEAV